MSFTIELLKRIVERLYRKEVKDEWTHGSIVIPIDENKNRKEMKVINVFMEVRKDDKNFLSPEILQDFINHAMSIQESYNGKEESK